MRGRLKAPPVCSVRIRGCLLAHAQGAEAASTTAEADGPVMSAESKHVLHSYGWKSHLDPTVPKRGKGDYPIQEKCVVCKKETNWYCTSDGCRHTMRGRLKAPPVCSVRIRGCLLAHVQGAEAVSEEGPVISNQENQEGSSVFAV